MVSGPAHLAQGYAKSNPDHGHIGDSCCDDMIQITGEEVTLAAMK